MSFRLIFPHLCCTCLTFLNRGGFIGELRILFLEGILIGSVYMDLSFARIANGWTGFGVWGSAYLLWMESGWKAAGFGMIRAVTVLILFFFMYYSSMVGAGDIKLFCITGIHYDTKDIYPIAVLTLLLAFIISMGKLIYHRQCLDRIRCFFQYLNKCFRYHMIFKYYDFQDKIPGTWMHLSVPFCFSVLLWIYLTGRR